MNDLIQRIMDTVDKKVVSSTCKKILKKCSMNSSRDAENITNLALWLYVFGYNKEAIEVCDLFKDEEFDGNYTLWDRKDHAFCLKARILRQLGYMEESTKIIQFVNQYRHPELYKKDDEWFLHTLDRNIQSNLKDNCKAGARGWRLLKLEKAISYREVGNHPIPCEQLEEIIRELTEILSKEK